MYVLFICPETTAPCIVVGTSVPVLIPDGVITAMTLEVNCPEELPNEDLECNLMKSIVCMLRSVGEHVILKFVDSEGMFKTSAEVRKSTHSAKNGIT